MDTTTSSTNNKGHTSVANRLASNVLVHIFSFFDWGEVIKARAVCRAWRDSVLESPVEYLSVDSTVAANIQMLAAVMPNLRSLYTHSPPYASNELLQNLHGFCNLQILYIWNSPVRLTAAHIFQLTSLETLSLKHNTTFHWNLADLAALPNLKKLGCWGEKVTGDVASLQATPKLSYCHLSCCEGITGNLKEMASLRLLEDVSLFQTKVVGDIREIGPDDFVSLKHLCLSYHIFGAGDVDSMEEAESAMLAIYKLQRSRHICIETPEVKLSHNSPPWYGGLHRRTDGRHCATGPPLTAQLRTAGRRHGWRWINEHGRGACKTHWLDPEPQRGEDGYDEYAKALEQDEGCGTCESQYTGFYDPPTEEQYRHIWEAKSDYEIDFLSRPNFLSRTFWGRGMRGF